MQPSDFRSLRPELEERLRHIHEDRTPLSLYLDQLEDPRNIGRLFRLADAARLRELIMGGAPTDWEPPKKARRYARSTLNYVPHRGHPQSEDLRDLQPDYRILILEKTSDSRPFREFQPEPGTSYLLVLGNEKRGVHSALLTPEFPQYHLPMLGVNTSMNVAQAAAIAVYAFLDKTGTGETGY